MKVQLTIKNFKDPKKIRDPGILGGGEQTLDFPTNKNSDAHGS